MTHLRIIQNSGAIEEVSSSVIQKLYELASSGDLDNTSVLQGRINAPSAKISHVNYFMPQSGQKPYPEFYVTATILGLDFEDPEVERICIERWGSNGIVNAQQIQSIHYLNNYGNNRPFSSNTTITKFNEFQYFTGLVNDDMNGTSTGYVFYNCSNLSEITLPDNIPCIGVNMFNGCSSLTSITIPNSVRNVFDSSFSRCTHLQSLTFTGLTGRCDIGDHLDSLTSLTINEGAMQLCLKRSRITEISIPSTVTELCLESNTSLQTITLSQNHTNIQLTGQGLGECTQLREITNVRPDTFTWNWNEFYGLYNLYIPTLDIIVPEGTIRVNDGCCYQSVLNSVDLPSTITEIRFRAFEGCTLKRLIIRATTPPTLTSSNVFDGSYDNAGGCPIYVPAASVTAYQTASDKWSRYASRIKSIETDLPADLAAEQAA